MKAPDFVVIKGKLPSLNEYIEAERTNRYKAAKMKKEAEELIIWQIKQMKPIKSKIRIKFTWHEEKKRRDPDNVRFAAKFVLDAMQKCGKLPNDNASWIDGFDGDDYVYGKGQGVEIRIEVVKE